MPTYKVTAINVGSFDLGEADKVLTIFSAEKGLLKAVAKGSRKPGTKMSGRTDLLCVNELLLSTGRTFEIITQAQTLETFPLLRTSLSALTYGLYYAELTAFFGTGLQDESVEYFQLLIDAISKLPNSKGDPLALCMEFEFAVLEFLGYKPDLTFCIACRDALTDYKLSRFVIEHGGIVCNTCFQNARRNRVRERDSHDDVEFSRAIHITPLVWKTLILRSQGNTQDNKSNANQSALQAAHVAGQRLLQMYIEERAGKRFKSLDLLDQLESGVALS